MYIYSFYRVACCGKQDNKMTGTCQNRCVRDLLEASSAHNPMNGVEIGGSVHVLIAQSVVDDI